ncbi:MAG: hypothetical protein LBB54_07140 [Cellulomonadaceae bacterium]|nr:hypothetical protein [Cellulomonadaceae bacterium]
MTLNVDVGTAEQLLAMATGRVTNTSCGAGQKVESGTSPISVNGQPLIALATSLPLWQNLMRGERGADIASFNAELARLGVSASSGDVLTDASIAGFNELLVRAGGAKADGSINVSQLLWIPAPTVNLASCVTVGQLLSPGQTVAVSQPVPVSASLDVAPGATSGQRVLVVDGQRLPVSETGVVDDPDAMTVISSSSAYQTALAQDPDTPRLPAEWALAEPMDIAVVPPSAVITEAAKTCVIADTGDVTPVTIVGSSLGQTFVTISDPKPAAVNSAPSRADCGR